MKRITIFFFLAFLMLACGDGLREEVVATFDNGQASLARVYNRDNQWVRELYYYESGQLRMEGAIRDGQRDGEWISYFPDGKVQSRGFFEKGKRTGKATIYHENGNLYIEGYYKDGEKTGLWIYYDEQGYETSRVDLGE